MCWPRWNSLCGRTPPFIPVNQHFPGIGREIPCAELGHFLLDGGPFFRRYRDAQHDLTLSVCHCVSRSFPAKGFGDFPNKQNGRPAGAGRCVFGSVATLPMNVSY